MKKTKNKMTEIINTVYSELQGRQYHPSGSFDSVGRWYADNSDLISVRSPSGSWPYSELLACRTKKYVRRVCEKYNCLTYDALRGLV